jgi:hypothetical protein
MLKTMSALFAVLVAGWVLFGSVTNASAGYGNGSSHTTYVYRTVHPVSHVTRYHDVWRTNYAYRVHRVVHVTRVRPIVYVHVVTRVHHHDVAIVRHVNVYRTQYLPARKIVTHSVINISDHHRPHHSY